MSSQKNGKIIGRPEQRKEMLKMSKIIDVVKNLPELLSTGAADCQSIEMRKKS